MAMRSAWIGVAVVLAASAQAAAQRVYVPDDGMVCATARTRASLAPSGPWLPRPATAGDALAVYHDLEDQPAKRIEIFEQLPGIDLVVHIDRSTLCKVTVDRAPLFPGPGAAQDQLDDDAAGMELDPGTQLDSAAPLRGNLMRVTLRSRVEPDLRITGYVAASHVGFNYEPHANYWQATATVSLPPRFRLLDAPGGTPFVVSTSSARHVAAVLRQERGFALVKLTCGAAGWIAARELQPLPATDQPILGPPVVLERITCAPGYTDIEGCEHDPANTLPEGAPLFDAIGGRFVASVMGNFHYRPSRSERGWSRYDVATRFGTVRLWATIEQHPVEMISQEGASIEAETPPPPAVRGPPERAPVVISPTVLAANRIRGETRVVPDAATRAAMQRAGMSQLVTTTRLCTSASGVVQSTKMLRTTTLDAYDRAVAAALSKWVFRPYLVDGASIGVCSVITLVFKLP